MRNKNKLDILLDYYEKSGKEKNSLKKVFYRPSFIKCLFGFLFSFLFLFLLLFVVGFQLQFMYLILFLGDLIILLYYGVNLFTKKGFYLTKYVEDKEEDAKDFERRDDL